MTAVIALVLALAGAVLLSGGFLLGTWWTASRIGDVAERFDRHPEDYGT